MKRIAIIISLALAVNILFAQPTATLKIGTIYDPLPDTILVPVTCEAIENPLTGTTWITSFAWYIAYDTSVLYAGESESIATLLNIHPNFPLSNYLTCIYQDNPEPGWNTIVVVCSPCNNEAFPGIKFFDIQFIYNEGISEDPNIIWTSIGNFLTNMADDEGNEYILTLIDSYVGPYITEVPELKTETTKIWFDNGNISFNTETGGEFILFSLYGQQVMSAPVHPGFNMIPVKDKYAIYLVRIVTNNKAITQKIFIQ